MYLESEIKEFLQRKDIQELLANDDIIPIYRMFDEEISFPRGEYPSALSRFLIDIGIEPLDYINNSVVEGMFLLCENITNVIVPHGVFEIRSNAFRGCNNLETVTLPSTIKVIGQDAFSYNNKLRSINLPEHLYDIGPEAFGNCPQLVIKCKEGTYAHKYCEDSQLKYELI